MSIGASVVIKGDVTAAEDLTVAGRVEGNVRLTEGVLLLAPGSHVVGDISVPSVVVQGRVEGNLSSTGRVDVRAGASVAGSIAAATLVVADGAELTCRVEMPAARPHLVQPASPQQLPVAV